MARPYEEYFDEDKGKVKAAFLNINPEYWATVQGDSTALDNLKDILEDVEKLRSDIKAFHQENRPTRIEEAQKSIRADMEASTQNVCAETRDHLLSHDFILSEALKKVRLQEEAELSKIDQFIDENARDIAEQALSQPPSPQEISQMSDQEKHSHLKAEIHDAIDNSVKARMQVGMTMNRERERMIEEAKQNGSQDPQSDVKTLQKAMYDSVDEKLHKDIHAVFVKYGYDADHKQVSFIAESGEYHGMEEAETVDANVTEEADISQSNQSEDQSQ